MKAWPYIFALIVLLISLAKGATYPAPPAPSANNQLTYDGFIDYQLQILPEIWESTLKDALRASYPGLDESRLERLHLMADPDNCNLIPYVDLDKHLIVIGRGYLQFSALTVQPLFFNVIGADGYQSYGLISSYYGQYIPQRLEEMNRYCKSGNALNLSEIAVRASGSYFGMSDERYAATQAEVIKNPDAFGLANVVGAIPIFFPILHEAGHYMLNHKPGQGSSHMQETEADAYALKVIRDSKYPTMFAVGPLSIMSYSGASTFNVGNDKSQTLPCRVKNILENDSNLENEFSVVSEHRERYVAKAKGLKERLLTDLSMSCRR